MGIHTRTLLETLLKRFSEIQDTKLKLNTSLIHKVFHITNPSINSYAIFDESLYLHQRTALAHSLGSDVYFI